MEKEIRNRIDTARCSQASRELIEDYLMAVTEADVSYELRAGSWNNSIDVFYAGIRAGTVFANAGKIKIYNHLPLNENTSFGESRINDRGEWEFTTSTEDDVQQMLHCLRVNVESIHVTHKRKQNPAGSFIEGNRQISRRLRFAVLYRDNFTCAYCGRTPPEVVLHADHKVPFSQGGPTTLENLTAACADCNMGKSNRFTIGT